MNLPFNNWVGTQPLILEYSNNNLYHLGTLDQLHSIYHVLFSAITPFGLTYERAQAVSYLHSLNNVHDEVAIKNPTDTINIGAYTEPLTLWSWISIGIFCVVCPPFLYFTTR